MLELADPGLRGGGVGHLGTLGGDGDLGLDLEVAAEGLMLWRYLGGPWEPAGSYCFGER